MSLYNIYNIMVSYLAIIPLDIMTSLCYNIYSERRKETVEEKGSKKRMPTLVERFEAVVRENEQLKQKIKELEKKLKESK